MQEKKPTVKDWKRLYETAMAFGRIEPWKWMAEDDLFGVQDPATGQISYCCVMGMREAVYGMAAYSGKNGLDAYLKVQSGELLPEDIETMFVLDSLTLFYEERANVPEEDMEVAKRLGMTLRGRNVWPVFRNYKPGYHPWFLTRKESIFFSMLIEQAIGVALRFKDYKKLLLPKEKGRYFVRVPSHTDNKTVWKDAWLMPAPIMHEEPLSGAVDEIRIQRIKRRSVKQQGALEIDLFHAPAPIQEKKGERPFFPYAVALVEHATGEAVDLQLARPSEHRAALEEAFLQYIEKTKTIPETVLVRKEEVCEYLKPYASRLGAAIVMTERLVHTDNFKKGLYEQIIHAS